MTVLAVLLSTERPALDTAIAQLFCSKMLPIRTAPTTRNSRLCICRPSTVQSRHASFFSTEVVNPAHRTDHIGTERLFLLGANPRAKNIDGTTPLHYAAYKGHTGIVSLLVERKAPVDIANDKGLTPLHNAALGIHRLPLSP